MVPLRDSSYRFDRTYSFPPSPFFLGTVNMSQIRLSRHLHQVLRRQRSILHRSMLHVSYGSTESSTH
ncbi:hypothetical protein BDZ89DRAFT_206479 [Hymenopellis radicata]|nr:hypothetical protein BDZ89DRAFT_206479 [Hymenopellis radicata]